jgi:hypothetical protein
MADILNKLRKIVGIINQMLEDGVINAYALGGATAANIYIQSFNTRDFDFFVHVAGNVSMLDPLRPIIDYLRPLGHTLDGVEFDMLGQPVQFIPLPDALTEEAVMNADTVELGGFEIKVLSPEYLVAIMLQTHRPTDLARARIFWDQEKVDADGLRILIDRYNLDGQWQRVINL